MAEPADGPDLGKSQGAQLAPVRAPPVEKAEAVPANLDLEKNQGVEVAPARATPAVADGGPPPETVRLLRKVLERDELERLRDYADQAFETFQELDEAGRRMAGAVVSLSTSNEKVVSDLDKKTQDFDAKARDYL